MKKTLLSLCAMFALTSCEHYTADDIAEEQTPTEEHTQTKAKDVTFVVKGITEEYSTRATIASVGCTDLWIWEGTTLLAHKQNTDSDFDAPTLSLTYGSHDITFLASSSDAQSITSGVWTCSKVREVFAKVMNVTVSSTSSKSRQVQLARRSAKVMFTTTDNVPSTVSKVYIKVANHKSLDASLAGSDAFNYESTINIASKQGQTYSNFISVIPASATDEEDCDFTIRFLSSNDAVLYEYQRTLKVKANRCTNLTGDFFSADGVSVSVNTEWDTQLDTPLFSE